MWCFICTSPSFGLFWSILPLFRQGYQNMLWNVFNVFKEGVRQTMNVFKEVVRQIHAILHFTLKERTVEVTKQFIWQGYTGHKTSFPYLSWTAPTHYETIGNFCNHWVTPKTSLVLFIKGFKKYNFFLIFTYLHLIMRYAHFYLNCIDSFRRSLFLLFLLNVQNFWIQALLIQ